MIRFGTPAGRWVIIGDRARFGHRVPRRDRGERGAADHRRGPRRRPQRPPVDPRRLPGHPQRAPPARRLARRHLRPAQGLHRRPRRLLARVGPSAASRRTPASLIAARALQGAAAALLVPGSLAIISSSFHPDDRGRAVGAWSGLAGISGALGPFLGGWLVDAVSWRFVFFINLPLAAIAVAITLRHVPESSDPDAVRHIDVPGALLASLGLAGGRVRADRGRRSTSGRSRSLAAVAGRHRPRRLRRHRSAVRRTRCCRSRCSGRGSSPGPTSRRSRCTPPSAAPRSSSCSSSSWASATRRSRPARRSCRSRVLMLTLSARMGQLAQRTGPRLPMTVGPLVIAAGHAAPRPGRTRARTTSTDVLPALVVFGLGLATTVAPLTSAVLAAVEDRHLGVGSGVNNAVSRVAGLLSVALLPALVGLDLERHQRGLGDGFAAAMRIAAVFSAVGWRRRVPHRPHPGRRTRPSPRPRSTALPRPVHRREGGRVGGSVPERGVDRADKLLTGRPPAHVLGDAGRQKRLGHRRGVADVRGDHAVRAWTTAGDRRAAAPGRSRRGPAPPIAPARSASTRSSVTMWPPRATLTSQAWLLHRLELGPPDQTRPCRAPGRGRAPRRRRRAAPRAGPRPRRPRRRGPSARGGAGRP